MEIVKKREEVASFLGRIKAGDFPLFIKQESESYLDICSGKGDVLCRFINQDKRGNKIPFPFRQKKELEDIVQTMSEEVFSVADETLCATLEECEKFRGIIHKIWERKAFNDLVSPKSVMTQARKRDLHPKIAIALLGRVAKAGIMPLHRITHGKDYYDRRFFQQPHKMQEFYALGPRGLVQCLAPSPIHIPPAPITVAIPEIFPGDQTSGVSCPKEQEDRISVSEQKAEQRNGLRLAKYKMDGSRPDSDAQTFAYPTNPHEAGTYKHKAVADKLRKELSPILLDHDYLYEFRRPVKFDSNGEGGRSLFNQKEITALNRMMKELRGSDIVLVEYSVQVSGEMAGKSRKMDLVAYKRSDRTLRIVDWKFGFSPVGIDNNEQLKAYMQCLLERVFPSQNIALVKLFIVQPNGEGTKTHEIDMVNL